MTKINKGSSGFSLIELAFVLVIIGLLVGMGAGLMGPITRRAKLNETRDRVTDVYNSIIGYTIANKVLPADLTVLGVKTTDSYGKSLFYDVAAGITVSDLCTTQGTYLTVNDLSAPAKTNIAFIVLSQGENVCNETGTATPFTIIDTGVTGSCAVNATYGYDDIVMYLDIITLREKICNTFRIVTSSLPAGTEAVAYPAVTLQATDGTTPYVWSVSSGSLPSPLELDVNTGEITTDPPASDGTSSFTITATDQESRTVSRSFSITVNPNNPEITTLFLHTGTVSTAYDATLSATGGDGSYSWSLSAGSLPPGLNPLSAAGVLSGTPTTAGTYSITVQVTDGGSRTATQTLSITIDAVGGGGGGGGGGGSSVLWIGQNGGNLQSCDTAGTCTDHGSQGDDIESAVAFSSALWIGHKGRELQSCDSAGTCTSHGNQGDDDIKAMAVFDSKLWIGDKDGVLKSCDSAGSCTDHGDKGRAIESMAEFNSELWLGFNRGVLQSCDTSGSCTSYGDKGEDILAMTSLSGTLWIGHKEGELQSCNTSGSCTSHGDKGNHINAIVVFDSKIWIGDRDGTLQSCDSSGSCTNHGDKGDRIESMAVFNSELWLGFRRGDLQSCDTSGSCTSHGDQGDDINSMAIY